jgi:transcriptional regulator
MGEMAKSPSPGPAGLLPGTLDLLILKTLSVQPLHGYGIAQHLKRLSADVLQVEEGSLYPALQRMQLKGWIRAAWRTSPTGRRARYYELTRKGQKQLASELSGFDRMITAIRAVLDPA